MTPGPSLEELVELYLDRCHLGDAPDTATFIAEHPEHAAELLETLPLLNDLEKIGDDARGRSRAAAAELPELPGSDFRLVRKIGGGGMGVVFEAEQISLGRRVAVKLLAPSLVGDAARREQFEREARLVGALSHPNIVTVIGAGQSAGTCYYAMELVTGERLDRHVFADVREIAAVGLQAARALSYAHGCQVMHRDIKPSNLLLDAEGQLHVADFGLACMLEEGKESVERAGAQNGTLRYMPAERLLHGISSPSGDQYALGVTLYELATRRPVLELRSSTALFRRICTEPLPPLVCAEPDFAAIVNKCVAYDAAERYSSMDALAEDLRRFLAHEPVLASPAPAGRRLVLWARRKPAVAALAAIAGLCAVSAVVALAVGYARTADALRLAERNASLAGAALSGVFRGVESQAPSRRDTELLTELLPYYGELARRRDMPVEKIVEANRILGVCAYRTGNYMLAEKAFLQVAQTRPTAADEYLLAQAMRRQGKDAEADALFRGVAEAYADSTNAVDRFESARALLALAQERADDPDRARAFRIVADLLKDDPRNPDYRFQYALILGASPRLYASEPIPGVRPNAGAILSSLAGEFPDRPEYGLALVELTERRLRGIRNPRAVDRNGFSLALEHADRLLARYRNMPDAVSAVVRLRVAYADFLSRAGDATEAALERARTSGMLEMMAHNPETPAAPRFRFASTNGTTLAYRQIVVNRSTPGPATLVTVLHGRDARASDNARQLATPSLMTLLDYVQTHGEKTVVLLPQCPPKKEWRQLRPLVDELQKRKAREFRVPPKRLREIGETPLTAEDCARLFRRASTRDAAATSPEPSPSGGGARRGP